MSAAHLDREPLDFYERRGLHRLVSEAVRARVTYVGNFPVGPQLDRGLRPPKPRKVNPAFADDLLGRITGGNNAASC